jgi:hypothetical protein
MFKILLEYFRRLTLGGNKESSKRFIAMYVSVVLITYCVLRYVNVSNLQVVLGILTTFVLSLLAVASYESVKGVNKNKDEGPKD